MNAGIAGAGIAGRLLAVELIQAGWSVTLFDTEKALQMNNCSMVAGGMLTPVTELEKCDAIIFSLGIISLKQYWPKLLTEIDALDYFQHQGSIVVSHPRDASEMTRFTQLIDDKLPGRKNYTSMSRADILNVEPELNKWDTGCFFPEEGFLDTQQVMEKLGNYLLKQNAQFCLDEAVVDISPHTIKTHKQTYHYDMVFDCRGLGAKNVFPDLRGVRGELIHLYAPDVNITRSIRLLNPRYSLYLIPKKNHHYVLGASEIESEDKSAISVRTTLELLSGVYYLHAGFLEARVLNTLSHCRPTLNHHLPSIKYSDGFLALNGLYRHGFLISPTLIKEISLFLKKGYSALSYPELWERLDD